MLQAVDPKVILFFMFLMLGILWTLALPMPKDVHPTSVNIVRGYIKPDIYSDE